MDLTSQIHKHKPMAQQLIQTHYSVIQVFSEGCPSNLLYSTVFVSCVHLTLTFAFVKGYISMHCLYTGLSIVYFPH